MYTMCRNICAYLRFGQADCAKLRFLQLTLTVNESMGQDDYLRHEQERFYLKLRRGMGVAIKITNAICH